MPSTDAVDPLGATLEERARRVLGGGNTRSTVFVSPHPPYAEQGFGYEIVDVSGHRLIDAQNNYTSLIHGHAHPAVTEAAKRAIEDGSCVGLPTRHELALAEHLTARFAALERVRFTNSGTEAVMMAVRTARQFTHRDHVVRFGDSYHGTYDFVYDGRGVSPSATGATTVVPFNDSQSFVSAMDEVGNETACVLVDLLPNRAGLSPAYEDFVRCLRQKSRESGALLIVDEVISARLSYRGLHDEYSCEPDLITLGKMVGGGFPVGAFGGGAEIMDVFDPGRPDSLSHGGTFNANPVTMRAGLAAMEAFDAHEVGRLNDLGGQLREGLSSLGLEVTGRGSLARVHTEDTERFWWEMYRAGVLIAGNGLMALSTPFDDSTVSEVLRRTERAVS